MRTKINISFEFFPPKTEEAHSLLQHSFVQLCDYNPEFCSVTFGAGGSTRDGTLNTVKFLQSLNARLSIAPHLSCLGVQCESLLELLETYRVLNIKRIVALRGDLPTNMVQCESVLNFASELVAFIRTHFGNFFQLEVAAYPEIHPQARSPQDDVLNLKRKYDAGADRAITQYFFNPDAYFYFLDECAKQGINLPIIPGIMPITQFKSLARFSQVCGAEIPMWIKKRLAAINPTDLAQQSKFGTEVVYRLCETLIAGGAPGLHFYTLNKAQATLDLLELLGFASNKTIWQLAANAHTAR